MGRCTYRESLVSSLQASYSCFESCPWLSQQEQRDALHSLRSSKITVQEGGHFYNLFLFHCCFSIVKDQDSAFNLFFLSLCLKKKPNICSPESEYSFYTYLCFKIHKNERLKRKIKTKQTREIKQKYSESHLIQILSRSLKLDNTALY